MDIRYLDGIIKCKLLGIYGSKAYVIYLESGMVGNKKVGHKIVSPGDCDIIAGVRRLWKHKKELEGEQ